MKRNSPISTLKDLYLEYEALKVVKQAAAGARETWDIRDFAEAGLKRLRTQMLATARASMEAAEHFRKTNGIESWAMEGDLADAMERLGLYVYGRGR